MIADIQTAAQTANRVLDEVGGSVQSAATNFDTVMGEGSVAIAAITATMSDASTTFANANEALGAIYTAMESADVTLKEAQTTFTSVNALVEEDLDAVISDVRRASDAFTTTIISASEDIDEISAEVLAAARSASSFVGSLASIVSENERQVSGFLRVGLGEITRFMEEARFLVNNLDRLVRRVERDPARFLLGTGSSEFRR